MLHDISDLAIDAIEQGTSRLLTVEAVRANRVLAHEQLFAHRHPDPTCEAQRDAIRAFHGPSPRDIFKAFRGFAKTTMGEEGVILKAALGEFSYCWVLGNTLGKAVQRLNAIKMEFDNNQKLFDVFGDLRGNVWNEAYAKLSNGVLFQAIGAQQSLRGIKETTRPDFLLIDDLEEEDWAKTPEAIEKNSIWFYGELLPALAHPFKTPIRWLGTPVAENCLLDQTGRDPKWQEHVYPIKYLDENGEWAATWPGKFPLDVIDEMERDYVRRGRHIQFVQEYMCKASSAEAMLFKPAHFRYDSQKVRTWQPIFCMIDPARTTKKTSAMTGWAAWSWEPGGRLAIWEAGGGYLKPDEIVRLPFDLAERWQPIKIGFEEDGLNEWALQPIRHEQTVRGAIPLEPMRAPKGKIDFIRGLQPYFEAQGVTMVGAEGAFANLTEQLIAFPRALMDVPNALAYALLMRAGQPVYEDFTTEHIVPGGPLPTRGEAYLAMNADGMRVTAALCQEHQGVTRVLADWIVEGQALDVVAGILRAAVRAVGSSVRPVIGPQHSHPYQNHGLAQALNRASAQAVIGVAPEKGRAGVQGELQRHTRGLPALMVSDAATWTLRGFVAGFAYPVSKVSTTLAPEPEKGIYRTLLEGIESFVGLNAMVARSDEGVGNWQTTTDGRRYRSALRS